MPTMDSPVGLAKELTTMERVEHLLTVVACSLTGKPPHVLCPWQRAGIEDFVKAVRRG
jgi:hypothetical protein